jgi:hypothetical protein
VQSQFPFVKMISAEEMVGWSELEKARKMEKVRPPRLSCCSFASTASA